jgi:AraC-like DNA-binding protein
MSSDATSAFMRFSTRNLPVAERVPFWREVLGLNLLRLDIEPVADQLFEGELRICRLPGVNLLSSNTTAPSRWNRTNRELVDGNDDFVLMINCAGKFIRSQRGQDLEVGTGDAVCILNDEPASVGPDTFAHDAVMVQRRTLSYLVSDIEETARRPVSRENEALRLLGLYAANLHQEMALADPTLVRLVATHVQDLVAVAVGATRDGRQIAMARGVRAARLKAIKADFAANPHLSLTELATHQRVTPRYVQRLFEESGETFTDYAMEQRLTSAYRMLRDQHLRHLTAAAIAYQAGFNDLSHFNRRFRRRFGMTPTDLRNGK